MPPEPDTRDDPGRAFGIHGCELSGVVVQPFGELRSLAVARARGRGERERGEQALHGARSCFGGRLVRLPRMRIGYLGLGSNVGDRRANLQAAVDALPAHGVAVLASSSTYDTDPVGEMLEQPEFLNACVRVQTDLDPEALLDACKAVERELGREAGGPRHGPRPIDVDLLLLLDVVLRTERLTLPHEQVLERRFVLIPLLELDFGLAAPSGERLADALATLPVDEGVRRAGPPLAMPG